MSDKSTTPKHPRPDVSLIAGSLMCLLVGSITTAHEVGGVLGIGVMCVLWGFSGLALAVRTRRADD